MVILFVKSNQQHYVFHLNQFRNKLENDPHDFQREIKLEPWSVNLEHLKNMDIKVPHITMESTAMMTLKYIEYLELK